MPKPLILGSGSPRRKDLLNQMGLSFSIDPADADETLDPSWTPEEAVRILSERKSEAVRGRHPGAWILTADTLVALENRLLGKPEDRTGAQAMLKSLSGRAHRVWTGLTVVTPRGESVTAAVATEIRVKMLSPREINRYLATEEWRDAAGSYRIQGRGGCFIESISGSYTNVVGLPIETFYGILVSHNYFPDL